MSLYSQKSHHPSPSVHRLVHMHHQMLCDSLISTHHLASVSCLCLSSRSAPETQDSLLQTQRTPGTTHLLEQNFTVPTSLRLMFYQSLNIPVFVPVALSSLLLPNQTCPLARREFWAIATLPPTQRTASTLCPPPVNQFSPILVKPTWVITSRMLATDHPLQIFKLLQPASSYRIQLTVSSPD